LFSRSWGHVSTPVPGVLTQVGETSGSARGSQPVFLFDPSFEASDTQHPASYYQLQLMARLGF